MIDKTILHRLFCHHYSEMTRLARTLLYDDEEAEDAVQDIFVKFMQSDILPTEKKMRAYLMTSVRNGCINRIKQKSLTDQFRELYSIDADSDWQHVEQRMTMLKEIVKCGSFSINNL